MQTQLKGKEITLQEIQRNYPDKLNAKGFIYCFIIFILFVAGLSMGEVNPDLQPANHKIQSNGLVIDTLTNTFVPESK